MVDLQYGQGREVRWRRRQTRWAVPHNGSAQSQSECRLNPGAALEAGRVDPRSIKKPTAQS